MRSVKFFFLLSSLSFMFSLFWIQLITVDNVYVDESLIEEAITNVEQDLRYSNVYRKPTHLPKNVKFILLWTRRDFAPFSFFEEGQRSFLKNNCSNIDCYVTWNRSLFGSGNYTNFHAIAFNGRNMKPYNLPRFRSPHQKYIYYNMESSENYPVCHSKFDGFFNWTATYKLHSDVPTPYILIKDKYGNIIGPKRDMHWRDNVEEVYRDHTKNKTKAAAWFVSHCQTKSNRSAFVSQLQDALYPYGYNIDIFGKCGTMSCPVNKKDDCHVLLKKDYFFYMSLENSFAEDYVTEKLLTALNHDTIPVVYGGADYSRFLPPGSYIDGRMQSIYQLAAVMDRLAHTPEEYSKFFNWKQYYTYHDPSEVENVCKICEALNDKTLMNKTTTYNKFRSWWNPNYKRICKISFNSNYET